MRRLSTITVALLASVLLVTGCSPRPDYVPLPEPLPLNFAGQPLPSGSHIEPANKVAPEPASDREILGSLRPDDATPQERVPRIVRRDRLVVGVDQSQYLLSFRDPVTGELTGFEVELAREIAHDMLGTGAKVDFRFVDSSDRAKSLQEGRVDLVIRTMTVTPPRQDVVDFSTPYLSSNMRMLVPRGSNIVDISTIGKGTICVADGSTAVDMARVQAPDSYLLITNRWADCLMAVQQFQADAVLADDTILSGMAAQDPSTDIVSLPLANQFYAVGVKKGNEGLVRQVNSTMERIRKDGTWIEMYNKWFGDYLSAAGPPLLHYREEEEALPDDQHP
ncbi:glutamate ABC transporter substrate-binding protein [Corynebacterium breve]|uniref:Glutamate ABC transporter substrate-binding protein n=1 Tax=Corynebacterium breve TaxID=3049799 RepID=A0ABY8VCL4_9CORY|nr:glutamate ABC transporter substrate-binding protein [Corynebacterium breve]WIM67410.1 glutamate ABC transporter substrate-binding protein [Corynebacterium breve]